MLRYYTLSVVLLLASASPAVSYAQTGIATSASNPKSLELRARSRPGARVRVGDHGSSGFASLNGDLARADADRGPMLSYSAVTEGDAQVAPDQAGMSGPSWPQWGQNPQHSGFLAVAGQSLDKILADVVVDPLVSVEASGGQDLAVHYQTPLTDGNDVFMESKAGKSTLFYDSEKWREARYTWKNDKLVQTWLFKSDWKAPGNMDDFWEPVFHAALVGSFIYAPGAGGTIFKLNTSDGSVSARINPFGAAITPDTYTASPLVADGSGNIYYNVIQLPAGANDFYGADVAGSWLVKVAPDNSFTLVSYTSLLSQAQIKGEAAPAATGQCETGFSADTLPWPPSPTAVSPTSQCGTERPGLNIAPAIAPDGTIYAVTRTQFNTRYNYLIAINPDLTANWAASMRGLFHDGCNDGTVTSSILPVNGQPGGCAAGALPGVDPETNLPGAGQILDDSSASPTIAPDGTILFGAYTRYNYDQGHLVQFSCSGDFMAAYEFGWDSTPAIYTHGGTYSIVIKDNNYGGLGSYCDVESVCPSDRTATNPASPEAYFITQLDPSLNTEWKYQNTNTMSCVHKPDGKLKCVSNQPNGFEWCVNAPVVDANGVVYANSEDGNLYSISQGGTLKQSIFQKLAQGAAYTPASLGPDGKIYSQNGGHMFVVGSGASSSTADRSSSPQEVLAPFFGRR
jgi:hypothetical protein